VIDCERPHSQNRIWFVIDPRTLRDELEHQHRRALHEIHTRAEHAFETFLNDVARELDACRSLEDVRDLFRPEAHDLEELAAVRVLTRRDEIFAPGIYATALMRAVETELASVVANTMRFVSSR
jgi:hypothetical protein